MNKRFVAVIVSAMAAVLLVALCGCTGPYDPNASMKESTVEPEALHQPGTLRVGVDAASYPFAGQANGEITGLDVDVASALAQEMGLKVEFVDVGSEPGEALSAEDIDIVMGIEGEEAGDSIWTSDAYAPSAIGVFSMDEGAAVPKSSKNPSIAAQTSSLSAWLVSRQFGAEALTAEDDLKTVFQDLADGKVQYAAADAVVGTYVLNNAGTPGYLVALMQQPDGYCVGVASDKTALQTAVTQALSTVQGNGIMAIIMQKWTGGAVNVQDVKLTASAKDEDEKPKAQTLVAQALSDNADGETPEVGANAVTQG